MKICKVCKCENEEGFVYCKNCGALLEVIPPVNDQSEVVSEPTDIPQSATAKNLYENVEINKPTQNYSAPANNLPELVGVKMLLPEPTNPEIKTVQTVYVTPAQKAAIQYDMLKNK